MSDHTSREKTPIRYEYSRKPRRCPVCKVSTVATILFGLPAYTAKLVADLGCRKGYPWGMLRNGRRSGMAMYEMPYLYLPEGAH
jgi:hypothetical protein